MNETLAAMAQASFKSWVVDFDPVIDNVVAVGKAVPDDLAPHAELRKNIIKKGNSETQSLFPDEFEFTKFYCPILLAYIKLCLLLYKCTYYC